MRMGLWGYIHASCNIFRLTYEERALSAMERETIVSFAQELKMKFHPSSQQDNMPWVSSHSSISLMDRSEGQRTPDFKGMEEHYDLSKMPEFEY